jgi:hypothetical protein
LDPVPVVGEDEPVVAGVVVAVLDDELPHDARTIAAPATAASGQAGTR